MNVSLLLPSKLKAGDCIGIAPLAAPVEPGRFTSACNYIISKGFRLKYQIDPTRNYGSRKDLFSSYSPQERAEHLNNLFKDPEVSMVLAAKGGYGCMEVLPLLDFQAVRDNPKIFMGFSDITAMLIALHMETGLVSIHGPTLESAFARSAEQAYQDCLDFTFSFLEGQPVTYPKPEVTIFSGSASGKLLGGNLSLLASLAGTRWQIDLDSAILFIEDIAEKPYRIHRMLTQLKLAGCFRGLQGVLVGSLRSCEGDNSSDPSLNDVLTDIFAESSIPVFRYSEFGHVAANLPLPLGREVEIGPNGLKFLKLPFAT